MNGPMDPLRYGLADLAEQVRPVGLRDRVLRTSRRLAVRRAIMTSTAAVAVLAVASGVALAVLPQRGTTPPVTGTTSTPSPDTPPSTPPVASPPAPAVVDRPKILPGRLFYQSPQLPVQIHAWDGGAVTMVLQPTDTSWVNARMSPDGRKVAWVSDANQLFVANADGSGAREVRDNVDDECIAPAWTADSRRVLVGQVRQVDGRMAGRDPGYVEVASGSFQPIAAIRGCHLTLSPGGSHLAYVDGSKGQVSLARADGTASQMVPVLGSDDTQVNPQRARTFDIYSLSPDGNLLVCRLRTGDQPWGDVALDPYANAVIDTRTGKQVALPVTGQLINGVFLADGSLLARLQGSTRNELVLISKDWKVLHRIDEPAELRTRPLLAYIPA